MRCLSHLLLHCPHMPTLDSTPFYTTSESIMCIRTNMPDRELLLVLTSGFGASALFENSDLEIVATDRQLAFLPAPRCRIDLQICAGITSFSLTSPSPECSNPFASWVVGAMWSMIHVEIGVFDLSQPAISTTSTLPHHDEVSTTTSFPVRQTWCVTSRSARGPLLMSYGQQRTPCQKAIVASRCR